MRCRNNDCTKELVHCKGNKLGRFCSSSCRKKHYNKPPELKQRNLLCDWCQEPITDPKRTVYCSAECYRHAHAARYKQLWQERYSIRHDPNYTCGGWMLLTEDQDLALKPWLFVKTEEERAAFKQRIKLNYQEVMRKIKDEAEKRDSGD